MLLSGRIYAVCVLTGILALGEAGIQTVSVSDAEGKSVNIQSEVCTELDQQLELEYQNLEEKEAVCRERLQEKEAKLKAGGEVSQTEVMDLQEELRAIRCQKMALDIRMEK